MVHPAVGRLPPSNEFSALAERLRLEYQMSSFDLHTPKAQVWLACAAAHCAMPSHFQPLHTQTQIDTTQTFIYNNVYTYALAESGA